MVGVVLGAVELLAGPAVVSGPLESVGVGVFKFQCAGLFSYFAAAGRGVVQLCRRPEHLGLAPDDAEIKGDGDNRRASA